MQPHLQHAPTLPRVHTLSYVLGSCLCSERGVRPVTFSDWEKINQKEVDQGASKGKPREKVVQTQEMFDIINRK